MGEKVGLYFNMISYFSAGALNLFSLWFAENRNYPGNRLLYLLLDAPFRKKKNAAVRREHRIPVDETSDRKNYIFAYGKRNVRLVD